MVNNVPELPKTLLHAFMPKMFTESYIRDLPKTNSYEVSHTLPIFAVGFIFLFTFYSMS